MSFKIEGAYNTATVMLPSEDEIEDGCYDQIQGMVDHEALEGDNDISIMPDTHYGSGAVIGFTMPVKDRIVPNIIGVDIGCGMSYATLDGLSPADWDDDEWAATLDQDIRNAVPFGFDVNSEPKMHIVDDFPWQDCSEKMEQLLQHIGRTEADLPDWFEGYGEQYFKDLCKRVEYDVNRAICSLGSLGGGNHFIEFAESAETEDVAVIIHSGSRGIGAAIAQHWQDQATEHTFARRNYVDVPTDELTYFERDLIEFEGSDDMSRDVLSVRPNSLQIDREAILSDYEGEAIDGKFGQLKQFMSAGKSDSNPLDWLEGDEALGYYIDMIFAQTYASESRRLMIEAVADVANSEISDFDESVHNYIDFHDGIIRKGATPAKEGERGLVPYNMSAGSIIFEGKGNNSWNQSAPHGAGRVMSRTEAKNTLTQEVATATMGGIYTTNIPIDEAPQSYKDVSLIEDAIEPTAEIVDRLVPLHNLKAE